MLTQPGVTGDNCRGWVLLATESPSGHQVPRLSSQMWCLMWDEKGHCRMPREGWGHHGVPRVLGGTETSQKPPDPTSAIAPHAP